MRNPPRKAIAIAAACVAVVAAAAGCGPGRPPVHPVSGAVRLGGRPLAGADVTFVPPGGRAALAQTDASGQFQLRTWTAGDGAVAGEHVVCITKLGEPAVAAAGTATSDPYAKAYRRNIVPPRYASPKTSPLRATVTSSGPNVFRFDLERSP